MWLWRLRCMPKVTSIIFFFLICAILSGCTASTPNMTATLDWAVAGTYAALTLTPATTLTATNTATQTPAPTKTPTPTQSPTNTPTVTFTPEPSSTPTTTQGSSDTGGWLIDLHVHTVCSDGDNTYEEMIQTALAFGIDLIAMTDHVWCEDVAEACRNETRLVCLPGQEVSPEKHILGIGLTGPVSAQQSYADIVAAIHAQGGLAIAAHPFLLPWRFDENELVNIGVDAMECWRSSYPEDDQRQQELTAQYGIPCVHNSDAHEIFDIGTRYMECSMEIHNLSELEQAIRGGYCQKKP